MSIYFAKTPEGQKAYEAYKEKYNIALKKKYNELSWDPEDPEYSKYPRDVIEIHNTAVREQLERETW